MPKPGVHVTLVQLLAQGRPEFRDALGDPDPHLPADDPAAKRMRYACLGAIGPDLFYALADIGPHAQPVENLMTQAAASFRCVGELSDDIGRYVDGSLHELSAGITTTLGEISGTLGAFLTKGILALATSAANPWALMEPPRQKDYSREEWFWADFLHYVRSGAFVRALLDGSRENEYLRAYALGYLTHYTADVIGHPYVNQIVRAPYRLAWQRHFLVENYMDAYVWPRWHEAHPVLPGQETPLDSTRTAAGALGTGARYAYARLHRWIDVGDEVIDPVDRLMDELCDQIRRGLAKVTTAVPLDTPSPDDAQFRHWCQFMQDAIWQVYGGRDPDPPPGEKWPHPMGLGDANGGYPTAQDIAGAYSVMRLLLSVVSEEKVREPVAPVLASDPADVVQKLEQVVDDLVAGLPQVPTPTFSPPTSIEDILRSLREAGEFAEQVLDAISDAASEIVETAVEAGETAVRDGIKWALYQVQLALWNLYRTVRDVLVVRALATPLTDDLFARRGQLDAASLWIAPGDLPGYPIEELLAQAELFGGYEPATNPKPGALSELPVLPSGPFRAGDNPDQLLGSVGAPTGPDDLFSPAGPIGGEEGEEIDVAQTRDFGAILPNCAWAIGRALEDIKDLHLPDYNLDGDRGYAWPCWDTPRESKAGPPLPDTLLHPEAPNPQRTVTAHRGVL